MGDLIDREAAIAVANAETWEYPQDDADAGNNYAVSRIVDGLRALPSATQAGGWMPPEDREDGFECLGWIPYTQRVGGRWDIVEWFSRPPGWEDPRGNMAAPIAFAPLPPAPEGGG